MTPLTLALLLVTLGVTHAVYDFEKAERDFNACKVETKAKETFEETIKQNKNPETHEGKERCLLECLLRTKGIYDQQGKYSAAGTQKYFADLFSHNPELVPKVVDDTAQCEKISVKGLDKCEAAVERLRCASMRAAKPIPNMKAGGKKKN